MKVIIVSSVFHPEPVVSAHTSRELALQLVSKGYSIKVITAFPNRPSGSLYRGYKRNLWTWEHAAGGYDIVRLYSLFSSQSSILSRFLENISFGIASGLAILILGKPDVIYANTWPIFAQGLLVLACKLRRIPLALSVQDLYPESLLVQKRGLQRMSPLFAFLHWLDAQIARNCTRIIVISEKFKEVYVKDRGIHEHKITVIPNWIDDFQPVTTSAGNDIREMYGIPAGAFLVVYGGNIGVAAGVENLIVAFKHLRSQKNLYLLVAGAGSRLLNCRELVQKHRLDRVKIHSPWQTADTLKVLSAADLCVLPTQGEQALVSVPSKLLSYMMAERCVLALASPESETAGIISASQGGWIIPTNDSKSLANCIVRISKLPSEERNRRGRAGRSFALKHFSADAVMPKVVELLVRQGNAQ